MKKCKLFLLLTFLPFFMSMSCCNGEPDGSATVTVYNHSDFLVTDIILMDALDYPTLSELKQGESHKFNVKTWEKDHIQPGSHHIGYKINGKLFSVEHEESKVWVDYKTDPGGCYLSPHYIIDGAEAKIFIKNESYELVIKGGGYWDGKDIVVE